MLIENSKCTNKNELYVILREKEQELTLIRKLRNQKMETIKNLTPDSNVSDLLAADVPRIAAAAGGRI